MCQQIYALVLTLAKALQEELDEKLLCYFPAMGERYSPHNLHISLFSRAKVVIGDLNATGGQAVVQEIATAGGYSCFALMRGFPLTALR